MSVPGPVVSATGRAEPPAGRVSGEQPSELDLLKSFVPAQLVADLRAPSDDAGWAHRSFRGAAMFADVSGFARLADRLFVRYGAHGAELLSTILSDFFGHLVAVTTEHHGEIVKWSGDAFLAIWRDDEFDGRAIDAAAACAHVLVKHTLRPEQTPDVTLELRAAITHGPLDALRVGGHQERWHIVVTGQPIRDIAPALAAAPPSSVATSIAASAALGRRAELRALEGDAFALDRPPAMPPYTPWDRTPIDRSDLPLIRSLIPDAVLAQVPAGLDALFSELRLVTSAFLLTRGLEVEAEGGPARLHQVVAHAQRALANHGGVLAQAGADEKGIWLLGGFGVPGASSERDADGALAATWETAEALKRMGIGASGGVAGGRAFCGLIGSPVRREFTFTSRVVNLSARLMSRTEDAILVDAATARRQTGAMHLTERSQERFRGFEEPVATFSIEGPSADYAEASSAPRAATVVVGRDGPLAQIDGAIATLDAGTKRRPILWIEGDAGVGKSSLVRRAIEKAPRAAQTLIGTATRAERTTPYGALASVFARLLDVPVSVARDEERTQLETRLLATHPELAGEAALLNGILPVHFTDRPETEGLTGLPRAERTRRLLLDLLEQAAASSPTMLVVEDAHWLDGLSFKLLVTAGTQLDSLLLLVSCRPDRDIEEPRAQLLELERTALVTLGALDTDEVGQIAAQTLLQPAPEHLTSWLVRRSGGNPFFVHELLAALMSDGHIRVEPGKLPQIATPSQLDAADLPSDVEGVISARVDRLPATAQVVLKAASVVGTHFTRQLLATAHAGTDDTAIDAALGALASATMIEADGAGFRFCHDTLHRVTYERLPESQRKAMHFGVAEHLTRTHADDDAHASVLAQHWDRTDQTPRAIDALERAGQVAMRQGAFREASQLLARAQVRAVESDAPAPGRHARWARDLAEANFQIGKITECCSQGERSLVLLGRVLPASTGGWVGMLLVQVGAQMRQRFFGPRGIASDVTREQLLVAGRLAEAYVFANQPLKMIAVSLWAANQAPKNARESALGPLYAILGMTTGMMRLVGLARRYFALAAEQTQLAHPVPAPDGARPSPNGSQQTQLDVASGPAASALFLEGILWMSLGELVPWHAAIARAHELAARARIDHQADMLRMGLAMHAWFSLRPRDSLRIISEIHASASRRHDEQLMAWCDFSSASSYERLGEWVPADRHLERAGKVLERLGDVAIQTNVDGLRSLIALRVGDHERSRHFAEQSLELFAKNPAASGMAITAYTSVAEAGIGLFAKDHAEKSEKLARRAVEALEAFGRTFPVGAAAGAYYRGQLHEAAGAASTALRCYRRAHALASRKGWPWDEATACAALARLAPDAERAGHRARAHELLTKGGAKHALDALTSPS